MVLAVSSTASALTAAALSWRAPPPTRIEMAEAAPALAAVARRPTRVVPVIAADATPSRRSEPDDGERRAYEQAHRAHFFADAPALALVAWDQYLAAYPRGTFAPEARYNRALCLVRLRKLAAAAQALRPFTTGPPNGYRHREACLLLRWVSENGLPARTETACAGSN
jgi:TolA-binding protein